MADNPFFQLPPLSSAETPRVIQQYVGAGSAWQPQTETTPNEAEEDTSADPMPFQITLINKGTPAIPVYVVTVDKGYVNERKPTPSGAALALHSPTNAGSPGALVEFPITVGQQVTLVVQVNENGAIEAPTGDAVAIEITAENPTSTHYDPPIADETGGSPGVYRYKLGVLRPSDPTHDTDWIETYLANSHIDHFRELPRFKKKAGTYDIFKEYNVADGVYYTKGLKAGDGIDLVDDNQSIEVKVKYPVGGPFTGDITIRDCDGDPGATPPVPATIRLRLRVENGLIVAVNETETQKPLSNEKSSNLQSCCWVDDADHTHA